MKKCELIFIGIFLLSISVFGSNDQTEKRYSASFFNNDTLLVSFKVNGTGQSKADIETTLTSKPGVISATWVQSTKMVTVKYLSPQLQKTDLYRFLADVGYDTEELRAKNEKYNGLSSDKKYTRDPETE